MDFAERTNWPTQLRPLTAMYERLQQSGAEVLDLTVSNPTRCDFRFYTPELLAPLSADASLRYDAEPFGMPSAREAVAAYYQRRGIDMSADRIVLTASTSEAYGYIFRLIADPGSVVAVPLPGYPLFDFLADCHDLSLAYYDLDPDDEWRIDLPSLERALESGARILMLIRPSNPTGSVSAGGELEVVIEMAGRHGAIVVSDEVFADYPLEAQAPDPLPESEDVLTITLGGLSKSLCLPQMKLGWMAFAGPEADRAEALARLEFIADTYLSLGAPVQAALPEWFRRQPDILAEVRGRLLNNLNFLRTSLTGTSCSCPRVDGGWSAAIRVPATREDEAWAMEMLVEGQILVHPGSFYGFRGGSWLVVSLLVPEPRFAAGIGRMLDCIRQAVG